MLPAHGARHMLARKVKCATARDDNNTGRRVGSRHRVVDAFRRQPRNGGPVEPIREVAAPSPRPGRESAQRAPRLGGSPEARVREK